MGDHSKQWTDLNTQMTVVYCSTSEKVNLQTFTIT